MSDITYMIDKIEKLSHQLAVEEVSFSRCRADLARRENDVKCCLDEIEQLKRDNTEQTRLITVLKSDGAARIEALHQEIHEMQSRLDVSNRDKRNWNESYNEVKIKYDNSQRGNKTLRGRCEAMETRYVNLAKEYDKTFENCQALSEKVEKADKWAKERVVAFNELREQVGEKDVQIENLEFSNGVLREGNEVLRTQRDALLSRMDLKQERGES